MSDKERVPDDEFPWSIKQVTGALKACINDHGDITRNKVFSAAKRIVNQLYGATAPTQATARLEASYKRQQRLEDAALSLAGELTDAELKIGWFETVRVPQLEREVKSLQHSLNQSHEQLGQRIEELEEALQEMVEGIDRKRGLFDMDAVYEKALYTPGTKRRMQTLLPDTVKEAKE